MEVENQSKNQRIVKNTLMLYFRMLLLMVVTLYTSRVVLQTLGVSDFGVYNVVGGVVAMFAILSNSLSKSISRYLTFELGKGNKERLVHIFCTSVNIQAIMALIICLVGEIGGLWFINYKMNIDPDRIYAANWVLQFSLLNFAINLISVPYNAAVVAHERMDAFAYISILEAALKLLSIYLLSLIGYDKLIGWAIIQTIIALIIRSVYANFCSRNFEESHYKLIIDTSLLKEMFGFASWNFIGSIGGVLRTHGVNMLLNVFFGTTVNAARGVAVQVNNAINGFATNFIVAVNPQITKLYARNEVGESYNLCITSARLSYFLLLLLSLPVCMEIDPILTLWLKDPPAMSSVFIRLTLLLALVETVSLPLVTLQLATGNIRNYQIVVGGMHLLNFPLSWAFLNIGFDASIVYWIAIALSETCLFLRLMMLKLMAPISIGVFIKQVVLKTTLVLVTSLIGAYYIHQLKLYFIVSILLIGSYTLLNIIVLGLNQNEIAFIKKRIRK